MGIENKAGAEGGAAVGCSAWLGCECWSTTNKRLKEQGYKLADVCSMLTVTDALGLHAPRGVPLERADGARLKRADPRMLQISYCPFCGQKYPDAKHPNDPSSATRHTRRSE